MGEHKSSHFLTLFALLIGVLMLRVHNPTFFSLKGSKPYHNRDTFSRTWMMLITSYYLNASIDHYRGKEIPVLSQNFGFWGFVHLHLIFLFFYNKLSSRFVVISDTNTPKQNQQHRSVVFFIAYPSAKSTFECPGNLWLWMQILS